MDRKIEGLIRAEGEPNRHGGLYSRFRLEVKSRSDDTGPFEIWTFNITADFPIVKFYSAGASNNPPERTLFGTYQNYGQFASFDRFKGSMGDGRFFIRTDLGVELMGDIIGGPVDGQGFVGSGVWVRS